MGCVGWRTTSEEGMYRCIAKRARLTIIAGARHSAGPLSLSLSGFSRFGSVLSRRNRDLHQRRSGKSRRRRRGGDGAQRSGEKWDRIIIAPRPRSHAFRECAQLSMLIYSGRGRGRRRRNGKRSEGQMPVLKLADKISNYFRDKGVN